MLIRIPKPIDSDRIPVCVNMLHQLCLEHRKLCGVNIDLKHRILYAHSISFAEFGHLTQAFLPGGSFRIDVVRENDQYSASPP